MDSDLDALKQRAEAAEAKLSAIKQKRKETMQRYYKKREAEGRIQISLVISKESNEIINSIRSKSILDKVELSAGQIVDRALKLYNESIKQPVETKKDIPTHKAKALPKPSESSQPKTDTKTKPLTESESQSICEPLNVDTEIISNNKIKIAMENLTTMFQSGNKPDYRKALIEVRNLLRSVDEKQWTYSNIAMLFNQYQLKTTGKSPLPFDKVKIRDLDQTSKIPHK